MLTSFSQTDFTVPLKMLLISFLISGSIDVKGKFRYKHIYLDF